LENGMKTIWAAAAALALLADEGDYVLKVTVEGMT
jgi:hypothetical protein